MTSPYFRVRLSRTFHRSNFDSVLTPIGLSTTSGGLDRGWSRVWRIRTMGRGALRSNSLRPTADVQIWELYYRSVWNLTKCSGPRTWKAVDLWDDPALRTALRQAHHQETVTIFDSGQAFMRWVPTFLCCEKLFGLNFFRVWRLVISESPIDPSRHFISHFSRLLGRWPVYFLPGSLHDIKSGLKIGIKKEAILCRKFIEDENWVYAHIVACVNGRTAPVLDTYKSGKPMRFKVNNTEFIKGFNLGLWSAWEGEIRRITIPPELAYHRGNVEGLFEPYSSWIVDAEILEVVKEQTLWVNGFWLKLSESLSRRFPALDCWNQTGRFALSHKPESKARIDRQGSQHCCDGDGENLRRVMETEFVSWILRYP